MTLNCQEFDSTLPLSPVMDASSGAATGEQTASGALGASLVDRGMPIWKRAFDIIVASVLLVLLSPLLLAIAIYIRRVSPGPILFRQSRLGLMGREFVILKFRTMHVRSEAEVQEEHRAYVAELVGNGQAAAKPAYGSRLIRGGHFLRSKSLDELPQLINVLRGEMSLIGPRPDVLDWNDYPDWQKHRFEVLPGITGLWQVSGKNSLSFDEMVQLDLQYIARRSLRLDAWILWRTLFLVVGSDNH